MKHFPNFILLLFLLSILSNCGNDNNSGISNNSYQISYDTTAHFVLGQVDFNNSDTGISSTNFNGPICLAIDDSGTLYVGDYKNCRIIGFKADSTGIIIDTSADFVLGQSNFIENSSGFSDIKIKYPSGLRVDNNSKNLYVSDYKNNRVLRFPIISDNLPDTKSDLVFDHDSFLRDPLDISFDKFGNLYVCDVYARTIIRFEADNDIIKDTAPDFIIGQSDYSTKLIGISDTLLITPTDIEFDRFGNLYVCDYFRVLRFDCDATGIISDTHADFVIGQKDLYSKISGVSDTLFRPSGIIFDRKDNLYISDRNHNRVLIFYSDNFGMLSDTKADFVLGQQDFFSDTNFPTASNTFYHPREMVFDRNENLYVIDQGNNRILRFEKKTSDIFTSP